jgi:hypothetical protein
MSKTAMEVLAEQRVHGVGIAYRAEHIIAALDAAGFVIVLKEQDDWDARERAGTIAALRELCGHFGDNDWTDDLHLADVVEKHLGKHLHVRPQEPKS